eukprot:GILJ01013925.1.p1 GENE.GILJ01013925.1~~GILJ01013925.1.p1  ORF type:complete len:149 (+),score=22.66 GILJ01013925.1:113-559(+)
MYRALLAKPRHRLSPLLLQSRHAVAFFGVRGREQPPVEKVSTPPPNADASEDQVGTSYSKKVKVEQSRTTSEDVEATDVEGRLMEVQPPQTGFRSEKEEWMKKRDEQNTFDGRLEQSVKKVVQESEVLKRNRDEPSYKNGLPPPPKQP